MSIVSQEIWDNLPEEFKHIILAEYDERLFNCAKYGTLEDEVIYKHYEYMFGKENLV